MSFIHRPSGERGFFDHGWLKTYHTFSFGDYFDRQWMNFQHLRVINEDFVAPKEGFETHSHKDMEIITYILSGTLEHKDSMGNGSQIRAGDVQYMSAGSGVTHSEFNPSAAETVHLLQIWILPEAKGLPPRYNQKSFDNHLIQNQWNLLISKDGRNGSIAIRQEASLFLADIAPGHSVEFDNGKSNRPLWLHIASGSTELEQVNLKSGDGAGILDASTLTLQCGENPAKVLLFQF